MYRAGREQPAQESKKPTMSIHPEHHQLSHLFELIDGLDEGAQWALIRELKLTAHTVAKDLENQI